MKPGLASLLLGIGGSDLKLVPIYENGVEHYPMTVSSASMTATKNSDHIYFLNTGTSSGPRAWAYTNNTIPIESDYVAVLFAGVAGQGSAGATPYYIGRNLGLTTAEATIGNAAGHYEGPSDSFGGSNTHPYNGAPHSELNFEFVSIKKTAWGTNRKIGIHVQPYNTRFLLYGIWIVKGNISNLVSI